MICFESAGCAPLLYIVLLAIILAVGWHGAKLLNDDKITWREFATRWWLSIFGGALILAVLYLIQSWHGY